MNLEPQTIEQKSRHLRSLERRYKVLAKDLAYEETRLVALRDQMNAARRERALWDGSHPRAIWAGLTGDKQRMMDKADDALFSAEKAHERYEKRIQKTRTKVAAAKQEIDTLRAGIPAVVKPPKSTAKQCQQRREAAQQERTAAQQESIAAREQRSAAQQNYAERRRQAQREREAKLQEALAERQKRRIKRESEPPDAFEQERAKLDEAIQQVEQAITVPVGQQASTDPISEIRDLLPQLRTQLTTLDEMSIISFSLARAIQSANPRFAANNHETMQLIHSLDRQLYKWILRFSPTTARSLVADRYTLGKAVEHSREIERLLQQVQQLMNLIPVEERKGTKFPTWLRMFQVYKFPAIGTPAPSTSAEIATIFKLPNEIDHTRRQLHSLSRFLTRVERLATNS